MNFSEKHHRDQLSKHISSFFFCFVFDDPLQVAFSPFILGHAIIFHVVQTLWHFFFYIPMFNGVVCIFVPIVLLKNHTYQVNKFWDFFFFFLLLRLVSFVDDISAHFTFFLMRS